MNTIYILLTRSGTLLSNLVYLFTGDPFTHASISFDPTTLQPLYSSARKNGENHVPRRFLPGVFPPGLLQEAPAYPLRPI